MSDSYTRVYVVMDLRGPRRSLVRAERVGLAFHHIFLCSLYLRGFPQPQHLLSTPLPPRLSWPLATT